MIKHVAAERKSLLLNLEYKLLVIRRFYAEKHLLMMYFGEQSGKKYFSQVQFQQDGYAANA
jgi:Trm5-related predicted tRNA methylase